MGVIKHTVQKISSGLAIASDWFLILLGLLLIPVALWRIDVALAKYVVICAGAVLSGMGLWYRFRRLKRQRVNKQGADKS